MSNNALLVLKQLEFLSKGLGLEITFKDTSGFLHHAENTVRMALISYLVHQNRYCEYIKTGKGLLSCCVGMAKKIEKKCKAFGKTFTGMCHAGVREYIQPVFSESNELIGFFTIGSFREDFARVRPIIEKRCRDGELFLQQAEEKYMTLREHIPYSPDLIDSAFVFICRAISEEYERIKALNEPVRLCLQTTFENAVLSRVISHIQKHYSEKLNVPSIAKACNCSESYINHIFKSRTGVSVSNYINWVRTRHALELLHNSKKSITHISMQVGFSDASYFSKVFRHFYGMTPVQYRKNKQTNIKTVNA